MPFHARTTGGGGRSTGFRGLELIVQRSFVAVLWLLALGLCGRLAAEPKTPFGPAIVWRGGDAVSVQQCNMAQTMNQGWNCLIGKMRAGQASRAAIAFSERLNGMDNPGWADSFRAFGDVALVTATYPFRANTNSGYLLVNGSPSIVDTQRFALSNADKSRLDYRRLMAREPQVFLITPIAFDHRESLANGVARFVFTDDFAKCHACERVATGYLAFDFDGKSRFLGTRLLRVGPPPNPVNQ
jgi:hypothetical protein